LVIAGIEVKVIFLDSLVRDGRSCELFAWLRAGWLEGRIEHRSQRWPARFRNLGFRSSRTSGRSVVVGRFSAIHARFGWL